MKKYLSWASLAFLVFFVATRPDDAVGVTQGIGRGLREIATGFSDFFTGLA
ncbi:MAG: hypothetical protein HOQ05_02820 [Corynebacteriales bacterium]|nr:hypothetical protein [Mycobacteriales bacterium]